MAEHEGIKTKPSGAGVMARLLVIALVTCLQTASSWAACTEYKLMRVTVVLGENADGSRNIGETRAGKIVPRDDDYGTVYAGTDPAWHSLRNPAVHTTGDDNYIRDWIRMANRLLYLSGACFGLDVENVQYEVLPEDRLNSMDCGHTFDDTRYGMKFFKEQSYSDSVILYFNWGRFDRPNGGACTAFCEGTDCVGILFSGVYKEGGWADGERVFGTDKDLLTHELGHFMGCPHPFSDLGLKVLDYGWRDNWRGLPFTKGNAPLIGLTWEQLKDRKKETLGYIKTWAWQEGSFGYDEFHPYGGSQKILDTPFDLTSGLPMIFGDRACEGDLEYRLKRYDPRDLEPKLDSQGKPIPWQWQVKNPVQYPLITETVTVDDTVRNNVMGYWGCDRLPDARRFSADQVAVMEYVLDKYRSGFIAGTIEKSAPPIALCKDVTVKAGESCKAAASIDNGSFDPDGESVSLTQNPEGPYTLGKTGVTLTAADTFAAAFGVGGTCEGTVTVIDKSPPEISCPPGVTIECSADLDPVNTGGYATAIDNCGADPTVIFTDRVVTGESCPQTKTIKRRWKATDGSGNVSSCTQTIKATATPKKELHPTGDAWVSRGEHGNEGTGNHLKIQKDRKDGYIRFDLGGLCGAVTSATLTATTSLDQKKGTVHVHGVKNNSWKEETIDGENAPAIGSRLDSAKASGAAGEKLRWDVTQYVRDAVCGGAQWVSFVLTMTEGDQVYFSSKENKGGREAPVLRIE